MRNWFSSSSPTARTRRLPRWSMSSTDADVLAQLQQVADRRDEVRRIQRAVVERRFQAQLDVELQAAHAAEIVLARIEEHSVEQMPSPFRASEDRPDAACGRFRSALRAKSGWRPCPACAKAPRRCRRAPGKKTSTSVMPASANACPDFRRQRLVGFQQNFAGLPVDQVADRVRAFEIGQRHARPASPWP